MSLGKHWRRIAELKSVRHWIIYQYEDAFGHRYVDNGNGFAACTLDSVANLRVWNKKRNFGVTCDTCIMLRVYFIKKIGLSQYDRGDDGSIPFPTITET